MRRYTRFWWVQFLRVDGLYFRWNRWASQRWNAWFDNIRWRTTIYAEAFESLFTKTTFFRYQTKQTSFTSCCFWATERQGRHHMMDLIKSYQIVLISLFNSKYLKRYQPASLSLPVLFLRSFLCSLTLFYVVIDHRERGCHLCSFVFWL